MIKFSRYLLIPALAALALAGPACAQDKAQTGSDNPAQLMQTYRQKSQQLHEIQQKTIKNSPKLAAAMKQYQAEVSAAMDAHGYNAEKGGQHMQTLMAKLKSKKKLSKDERKTTIQSLQAERQKMMKARTAAMKDPKVQKDGKALQQDVLAAMKKQDNHTGQLLKDVRSLRTRIMASSAAHGAKPKNNG
ncbi:MAG: hypothetical protein WBW92_05145 [Rhodanobacteraceae bacterium]